MSLKNGVSLTSLVLVCIAMLSLGSGLLNWNYHGTVVKQLDRIEQEERKMITSKWTSGGDEVSWTSTRGEHDSNETNEQLRARHKIEVAEAKKDFPKDTRSGE